MATITLKGNPVHTAGSLPAEGSVAPNFVLTNGKLEDIGLDTFAGRRKILNITPSLDTGTCATSAARFNERVAGLKDTVLLNISGDLPFAAARLCEAGKWSHVVPLSTFRSPAFGRDYGVGMVDGPLTGLMSRAVLVLDENNVVRHAQQVPEIAQEPDYDAAIAALEGAR